MMNMDMMDSVISKLRNTVTTVTSTVSQLSVVLPGNPVTREYEIEAHIASAGPGLLWKVYSGYKKSTRQEAAVFVFEKRLLDKWSKRHRDVMIEISKGGVLQLTKLKHPRVLTVQHPLEESRDSLAFATEPIFSSLANVLGYHENAPAQINNSMKAYKLHDVEIKYGLLQISEALGFLHNDAKMLHGNLCLESIIIDKQGSWKVFGLDFVLLNTAAPSEPSPKWCCKEYDQDLHPTSQPHLDFLAPEYSNLTCSPASDLFSLGMLAYSVYNEGKPLSVNCGNWQSHRQNFSAIRSLNDVKLSFVPPEFRTMLRSMLDMTPSNRPDVHRFRQLEFLHDEGVKTLEYLDSMFQWDNLQKSKFYKGLHEILPKLPQRVRVHRVVPYLSQEFVNPMMVPFVLPNVLKIAESASDEEYVQHILPHIRPVMKLTEPVQILLIFMKYMELLLQKTPADVTKTDVLPMLYRSLESNSTQVQELCLSIIPSFASLVDYTAMKNALFPRIRKLCISTQSLSVRVNCLVCIGKILEHFDKWLVMDFVLPFLMEIPTRESAVIMGIIGICKLAVSHKKLGVTKEVIATKILPFLFPLSIESGLTLSQYSTVMSFIHELIACVETEHRAKLEQVNAISKERMAAEMPPPGDMVHNSDSFDAIFGTGSLNMGSSTTGDVVGKSLNGSMKSPPMNASPLPPIMQAKRIPEPAQQPKMTTRDLTSTLIDSNLHQMHKSFSMDEQTIQQPRPPIQLMANNSNNFPGITPLPRMPSSVSIPNAMQSATGTPYQFPSHPSPMMSTGPTLLMSRPPNTGSQLQSTMGGFGGMNSAQNFHSGAAKLSQKDIDDFLK